MLGTIEGSAGNLTFASRGGLNVLRQKVGKNSSNTPAQQGQRSKFGLLGSLARAMGGILRQGYKTVGGQTGYNRFMSVNARATSLDANRVPLIDFGMLEISAGSVTPLAGLAVAGSAAGQRVSFADNSDGNGALSNDKVYVAVVKKATGEVATSLGAVTRASGAVDVPAAFLVGLAAGDLAVYAFAKRAAGTEASNTARLGSGTASPAARFDTTLAGPNGSAAGVTLAASAGDEFGFNGLASGTSAPANMDITVGGAQVASVAYLDRYTGRPFRFVSGGVAHTGAFAAVVNF